MRPTECIWCGLELLDDTTHDTIFACGSVQHPRSDCWSQSTGCKEIMRSRERFKRAIEAIRAANRYYLLGEVALIPDETGNLTQACVLDDLVEILEGVDDEKAK